MKGLVARLCGVAAGAAALALATAPVAIASGDTIDAAAGMQFSGVVDQSPSCTPATATVNWGDNTAPTAGTVDAANDAISGSHTYSSPGGFSGTINLTGGNCAAGAVHQDTFTATVHPAPQFTQCPPVGADFGCQFLIVVASNGTQVLQDANQGPYENSEDALIGVVDNSSNPVASMPLSVPNSGLFSFDGDGLCNPGAPPVPAGCQTTSATPQNGTCSNGSGGCAFPAPPGEPAGYTEPGAPAGSSQNGYEGPTTWYSGISSTYDSGQVNFSPPLQPGQSTYFSLEEPPTGQTITAGSAPTGLVTGAPPSVSNTRAEFAGVVNPNGSATTAWFQYGLDQRYLVPGGSGPSYDQQTPPQAVGGDFAGHFVVSSVSGLVPNALYHVRLVAQNGDGITYGPDQPFFTRKDAPPGPPVLGRSVDVYPLGGLVFIRPPAGRSLAPAGETGPAPAPFTKGQGFIPLTEARRIPAGSQIDARFGSIKLVTAPPVRHGKRQSGTFAGGIFKLTQARLGVNKGLTTLSLLEGLFRGAPTFASCPRAVDEPGSAHAALSSNVLQRLTGSARGRFRTVGRYAAASVRGTNWGTVDRCDGTLTTVHRGVVQVTDFVRHATVALTAGRSYLARAPSKKKKR